MVIFMQFWTSQLEIQQPKHTLRCTKSIQMLFKGKKGHKIDFLTLKMTHFSIENGILMVTYA